MKESLIILSFSSLLLVSSSILSQPTDETNSPGGEDTQTASSATFITASESSTGSISPPLVLAKVNNIENSSFFRTSPVKTREAPSLAEDKTKDTATQKPVNQSLAPQKPIRQTFSEEEMAQFRQLFLKAEHAIKRKNDSAYFLLSNQLKDYPLYPYLQYQWLRKHLDHEKQIIHFLETYKTSRYADKLKRKWLRHLGKNKQWSLILQNPMTTSNATLNCYYHRAQFNAGNKTAAIYGARDLWVVGHSQPRVCDPLFSQLKKSELFTQELRWQRFEAALKNNKVSLATYIKKSMPAKYHASAQMWIKLHRNPARYMQPFLSSVASTQTEQSPLMFRHAINRLAGKDITAAIKIWDDNKYKFELVDSPADKLASDKVARNKLERRLAFKLAFKKDSAAYERLGQLNKTDNSSRTLRVRVALLEQNWHNVITAIQDLREDEKQEERWQYWLARAYLETGTIEQAEILLTELSTKRSFYGFLAADKVNSLYQLSDNPVNVTLEEIIELKNRKEFRVAFELMALDKKNEAKLQWWHASRALNKNEILIAAKLAQQWQWDEIAIFTIAKAKYWDDIEVRFPLSYADKILENSALNNLNPVIIYGLIRRESAFNEKAHSPTGARGLMQIMPRTGRNIAKNLNERWRGNNSLYNPVTNLKYGSYYYQKLLNKFDGHYAIALAAYNAGPSRVKKWLPKTESISADVWIETIPYKETREYVINVLAYALIYQQRTRTGEQVNELSMNDFTRDVLPLSVTR